MKLLIASNNKHKINEIQSILDEKFPSKYQALSPANLSLNLDVEENADTLEGNAELKARAFFEHTGIPVIADDTGLEVDALNGKPGVYSARFAGEPANDENNRRKILTLLKDIPDEQQTARFRTVICYIDKNTREFIEGKCEGKIINEERGNEGFGYDSVFIPRGFERTFAEMSSDEKNAISHRGRAVRDFADWLDSKK
jgi:XTP/dITP diphosphohydrolase